METDEADKLHREANSTTEELLKMMLAEIKKSKMICRKVKKAPQMRCFFSVSLLFSIIVTLYNVLGKYATKLKLT